VATHTTVERGDAARGGIVALPRLGAATRSRRDTRSAGPRACRCARPLHPPLALQCRSTAREVGRELREGPRAEQGQGPTKKEAQRNGDAHNNKQQKAQSKARAKARAKSERQTKRKERERGTQQHNDGLQAERKAQQHDPAARKRAESQRWPKSARKLVSTSRVEAKIRRTSEPK